MEGGKANDGGAVGGREGGREGRRAMETNRYKLREVRAGRGRQKQRDVKRMTERKEKGEEKEEERGRVGGG